jgi:phosphoribosylanthranilate isomerase
VIVKICGITRALDAHAAVEAGAAAIGLIFWPGSPRFVDPYRARAIVEQLPPLVTAVGVFVDQPAEYVSAVASLVRLGAVQLHGSEDQRYARSLRRPVIKSVPVRAQSAGALSEAVDAWPAEVLVLLDAHDAEKHGGTGRTIDWSIAASVSARRRTLLAGGLTPDNVFAAVERVRPFGIDVSSGVEQAPGIKDVGRIRALFEAVHAVNRKHDVAARS